MHDPNQRVKDAAGEAILKNMTPMEVDQAFLEKEHQRQTIKCAIREVLAANQYLQFELRGFLQGVLDLIEGVPQQQMGGNKENMYYQGGGRPVLISKGSKGAAFKKTL